MQNSDEYEATICGEPITASYFFLKRRKLQIFRIQRQGSAAVLWTSRTEALAYLYRLRDEEGEYF